MNGGNWLISGGRVVDPANGLDGMADVLIRDGLIVEVGRIGSAAGVRRFDAAGLVVSPGWIDLHVHLRVPGQEHKETILTGTTAAAAGGFTTICCMPNTDPALDSVPVLKDLLNRIAEDALVRVRPVAAISLGRQGREAVNFDALISAGAIGFSDDGDSTLDSGVMRQALAASRRLGRPVMVHCEDKGLAGSGAMHEGNVSRDLGIAGIPAEAEEIVIARDLMVARLTGGWLHVLHVSTGRGAAMVRQARSEGVNVTAEVMPHHLLMDDAWVAGSRTLLNVSEPARPAVSVADPNTKVNPPLRTANDTRQLLTALKDGVFDVVATDHAPHAAEEKVGRGFASAAFGMSGLEFALPMMLALVRAGHLSLSDVVRRLSVEPARLLGEPLGSLTPGRTADVVLFDPEDHWTVAPETLKTKSKNTPLLGMELKGRVKLTLVGGEERFHG